MSVLVGLGVVALLAMVGAPIVRILLEARPPAARLAWSFLVGCAVWGLLMFAGSHLFGLPLRAAVLRPLLGALALTGAAVDLSIAHRAPREPRLPSVAVGRGWLAAVAVLGALVWVGILARAVDPVVDIDGRVVWTAHARYMQSEGRVDAAAFRESRWAVSHPHYPPLLPLLQLTVLEVGHDDTRELKPLYATFWAALVLVVWDGARRLAGERAALAAALLAVTLPFPAIAIDGGAAGVYSDLPLAAFLGAAVVPLIDVAERARAGALAGLLLGAAVLAKNEGAVLAGCAGVAGVVAIATRVERRRAALRLGSALAGVAIAIALLASWRAAIPNRMDEAYLGTFSVSSLLAGVSRLSSLPQLVARAALDLDAWGITLPLFAAVIGWGVVQGLLRQPWARGLALAVLLAGGFLTAVYLTTSWPLAELVPVTWNRFVVQQLPLLLLLAAGALERLLASEPPVGAREA
jgi:hypothetical protein